jgi:hypothetical protein
MIRKFLGFSIVSAMFACSGTDTTQVWTEDSRNFEVHPDIFVPGQEGRIDGSPWDDGLFKSPEAKEEFCDQYGDLEEAWFCSDLGQTAQGFTTVLFHGILSGSDTCYGQNKKNDGTQNCLFPDKKQFKVKINTSSCFQGSPPPTGPSTLEEQSYLDAYKAGVKFWNGKGVTVVDDGASGSSNYRLIEIKCGVPEGNAVAEAGLVGVGTNRGALPLKLGNRDPRSAVVVNGTDYTVSVQRTYNLGVQKCGTGDGSMNLRIATAKYAGIHEAGHIFGFAHFGAAGDDNIMDPFITSCAPPQKIHASFVDALNKFDPNNAGVTVSDNTSLGGMTPL